MLATRSTHIGRQAQRCRKHQHTESEQLGRTLHPAPSSTAPIAVRSGCKGLVQPGRSAGPWDPACTARRRPCYSRHGLRGAQAGFRAGLLSLSCLLQQAWTTTQLFQPGDARQPRDALHRPHNASSGPSAGSFCAWGSPRRRQDGPLVVNRTKQTLSIGQLVNYQVYASGRVHAVCWSRASRRLET